MLLAAATILVGFILLIWSADLFVAGASSIAENMGMSPIIIGLTVVSLGTSAPEVLVSFTAALSGAGDLGIGNAIGSNIANVGLVLGATIIVAPLHVHESAVKRELATLIFVTIAVGLLIIDGELSRIDGYLMMTALVLIIVQMARTQAKDPELRDEVEEEELPFCPETEAPTPATSSSGGKKGSGKRGGKKGKGGKKSSSSASSSSSKGSSPLFSLFPISTGQSN